jgi:hypothetical protein
VSPGKKCGIIGKQNAKPEMEETRNLSVRAGIYMGWVGRENLGDEAMYSFCRERFSSLRWFSFDRLLYQPNIPKFISRGTRDFHHLFRALKEELFHRSRLHDIAVKCHYKLTSRLGGEVGLLGGGTLINQSAEVLESYVAVRKRTRSLVPVFGAGVASPDFWSTRSDWEDRRKEWVAVLNELPIVGVRGPLSKNLLDDAGAQNVVVCGDPAVGYHAEYARKPLILHPDRPLRVAINTGECNGNLWGNSADVQESLIGLVRWLKAAGHQVWLIPVWPEDMTPCIDLARNTGLDQSAVSPALSSHTRFLKAIETVDIVVALKLHAAILSAAANIPSVILGYQPKSLDYAASMGLEQFTIRTDELTASKLIELVSLLIEQLPSKKKELCRGMCKLSNLFEEYCRKIEPMLLGKVA